MKWYLATNEVDIFHYGSMEEDWEITTGQPNLSFYGTKEDLVSALESHGQQYQEPAITEGVAEDHYTPPSLELPLPEE